MRISSTATVLDSTHPVARDLPSSFRLTSNGLEQGFAVTLSTVDLDSGADFVIQGAGQASVVAYDNGDYRAVDTTGFPEYQTTGTDVQQFLYNALMWAAGYD